MATQATQTQLLTFLVGTFDAAPTAELFDLLEGALDNGATVDQLADVIVSSEYFTGLYADTDAFVANFPAALVGDFVSAEVLTAAQGIVSQWIEDGASVATVISNALVALSGVDAADETWGAAAAALSNKVSVAQYFIDNVSGFEFSSVADLQALVANVTEDAATVTTAQASIDAIANAGTTFTLTTGTDTFVGTAGNDTFVGTSATIAAGDAIIDQSSSDADVANLTLTAQNAALRISGVETVNVDWNAFADAAVDATNITGANIVLSSEKVGFLGNATITGTGANTVTGSTGMVGTLTVNGVTGATVEAGAAKTVTAAGTTATTDSLTVVAGEATTTVTAANTIETVDITTGAATTTVSTAAKAATVDASSVKKGATVTVTGTAAATDTASVVAGDDINVTLGATFTGTEKLTLDIADGKTVTLTGNAGADTVDVVGSGAATIKSAAANITADTVTNSGEGSLTLALSDTALTTTVDTSKVDADLVTLTAGANAVLKGASGQTFTVAAASSAATVDVTVATDSNADTATLNLTSASYTGIKQDGATDIETLTINAAAEAKTGADLTISTLTQGGNTTVLTGTNDVTIGTVATAGTIDANALQGDLIVGSGGALASGAINGATGKNTVTFSNVLADTAATFVGQSGVDKITVATTAVSGGANSVEGRATFVTGAGNDEISVTGVSAGTLTVDTGAGDDKVTLGATATGTTSFAFGEGSDTLVLAAGVNVDDANVTISGLDILNLSGATASIDATFLSGQTTSITGQGAATSTLTVNGEATASTIDLSGIVVTDSASTGVAMSIVGQNANDTIIGTSSVDTITGGQGADVLTGGAGGDTFVFGASAAGITVSTADTITDFTTASDKFKVGVVGTTGAVVDGASLSAGSDAGFSAFITAANAALGATDNAAGSNDDFYVAYNVAGTGDAWVAVDVDFDGTLNNNDYVVKLTGIDSATDIALSDFIA